MGPFDYYLSPTCSLCREVPHGELGRNGADMGMPSGGSVVSAKFSDWARVACIPDSHRTVLKITTTTTHALSLLPP